ncbi:MAG TPA: signal peptide peptidase SppA [Thermoanaerobaculia bacterium]|nr:signal peptide peptidase SppA [Thermoanaerobaculia bacterium]
MSEFENAPPPPDDPQPTPPPPPAAPVQQPAPVIPPPAPRKKSRAGVFFLGAFSGCLVIVAIIIFVSFLAIAGSSSGDTGELSIGRDKIAILPIEGEILESRDAIEALHRYANNSMVKGIVVRINSPGGAIAPSQEIYAEIRKTREKSGKPIIASMDSVAASGGYYIASACDEIVANPGTITGSIGVILQWFEMKDLVQWAKLKPQTITSGPMKAAGSPYTELSDADRAYLQRIVSQLHLQFVHAVAEGRKGKISEAEVSKIADGRVFTGEEAVGLKLVDTLGSLDDAVRISAKRAGIKGEPARLWPRKREGSLLELLSGQNESESMLERIVSRHMPRFLYRW